MSPWDAVSSIRFWDDLGDLYGFRDQPNAPELPRVEGEITGNFKFIRLSHDEAWVLVEHKPLRETKWVLATHIHIHGIANAFYDADPTFLPAGERNG